MTTLDLDFENLSKIKHVWRVTSTSDFKTHMEKVPVIYVNKHYMYVKESGNEDLTRIDLNYKYHTTLYYKSTPKLNLCGYTYKDSQDNLRCNIIVKYFVDKESAGKYNSELFNLLAKDINETISNIAYDNVLKDFEITENHFYVEQKLIQEMKDYMDKEECAKAEAFDHINNKYANIAYYKDDEDTKVAKDILMIAKIKANNRYL